MDKFIMENPLGVIKRVNQLLGLRDLDIFVEDTAFDSQYFRVLECSQILTQGKSSFLIGGSQYLKSQFQFAFIVSHIESMRDTVDSLLEISKEKGFSQLKLPSKFS